MFVSFGDCPVIHAQHAVAMLALVLIEGGVFLDSSPDDDFEAAWQAWIAVSEQPRDMCNLSDLLVCFVGRGIDAEHSVKLVEGVFVKATFFDGVAHHCREMWFVQMWEYHRTDETYVARAELTSTGTHDRMKFLVLGGATGLAAGYEVGVDKCSCFGRWRLGVSS